MTSHRALITWNLKGTCLTLISHNSVLPEFESYGSFSNALVSEKFLNSLPLRSKFSQSTGSDTTYLDKDDSEDLDEASEQDDSASGTKIPINPVLVAMKSPSIATYTIINKEIMCGNKLLGNRTDKVMMSFEKWCFGIFKDMFEGTLSTMSNKHKDWLVQEQTALGKDFSNPQRYKVGKVRSKSENNGIVSTEMELVLEQTQQVDIEKVAVHSSLRSLKPKCTIESRAKRSSINLTRTLFHITCSLHNVKTRVIMRVLRIILVVLPEHPSDTYVFTMKMEILLEPTSNKLMVGKLGDSDVHTLEDLTLILEILSRRFFLRLNLPDHRSVLTRSGGPIFDVEPLQKVQNDDDNYNVFDDDREYPEQPESVNEPYHDMCYDREQDDQDDTDEIAQERDLLASLFEKLKCEIDDSKNRNKFLKSSNQALVDKLKGEIEDFKTKNKSLESSNNHFKEANNELSKTNQLMFKDLKKFQAELDKYHDVNYASKVAIDCAKAKGDLMSYKIEFEKSCFYNDNLALMLAPETDGMIRLDKESRSKLSDLIRPFDYDQLNNLYDLFVPQHEKSPEQQYFSKPSKLSHTEYYYADHMNAILGVYTDIDEVSNLQCDYLETLEKCQHLEKELSKSRTMSKSFEALQKHAINLELDLQQCKEKIKNDKSFKINYSNVFLKEREQYFEIQDLKAQLQDKGIAISELKKLIEKMKGKSVETKFEKSSVIRQPNAFKSQRQSVLGKPAIFSDSLKKKDFSKSKSVTKNNVSNDFSKPVTAQILPQNIKSILKNTNVIASGMYKVHTEPNQTRTPQLPQDIRKTNKRVSFCIRVIPTISFTPPGYKWKPKSPIGNVNLNVSMPLGNASRNANILEPMTSRSSTLSNTSLSSNSFAALKFGNDQIALILGYGDLVQGTITIKRVYYVEGLNHNLFSVGQFCDTDLEVAFWKSTCYIRDLKGNDLLIGSCGTDLYSITLQDTSTPNPICLMAKAKSSQAWLWHHHLSQLNFDTINLLSKNNIVTGLPKLKFVKDHLCSSCELEKAKRKSFHTKTTPSSKIWLQLLHMDLCGPMRVESINGKKYVLVTVDDYSRYTWTHFLRSKDETPTVLIDFLTLVQRGLHAQVRIVRTDKGTEFLNKTFHAYFAKEGIRHETSTARTPEQNGIVKIHNRTLVEAARTMLSAAKVPLFFWAKAIATRSFTTNRSLISPRHEKTPYHIINGRKPSVKFFHIFGSLCYIIRDGENLDKMKEKGDACIFVGYSTQSRAYRVFNKRTRIIVEIIHVNFDELPQMMLDYVRSVPIPQCPTTVLEQVSLSPDPQSQENVPQAAETVTTSNELDLLFTLMFDELLNGTTLVVSKSSIVHVADAPDKRQHHNTTHSSTTTVVANAPPLNIQTTPQTTNQAPTQVPTVTANENITQAETNTKLAQVDNDEFINIFSTPVQEQGETPSHHVDSLNMHTFYQHHPSRQHWTKDHPLEQVIGNPSQSIRTRRQLETVGKMCMIALTVSQTEPKNIKEAMADSAWIESMQKELHQFDRLDV
ncbi:retrovirus-related pol polyprotein from transposon TNT 1-94 [Tanacetum coccineum]|uniref:Retrovirus-related pol polyprotein from transposon TNT 1-94 n=1 Tax=Tanacetum coccineum TaxID=301880 RepID=A0ABQ5EK54_9ASTR